MNVFNSMQALMVGEEKETGDLESAISESIVATPQDGRQRDSRDNTGRTLLHVAAKRGDVKLVRELIEEGADVNAKDSQQSSPLHLAAYEGNAEIIRVLIENGAVMDAIDYIQQTPLHAAAWMGMAGAAEALISSGARLDIKDRYGMIPESVAAFQCHHALTSIIRNARLSSIDKPRAK